MPPKRKLPVETTNFPKTKSAHLAVKSVISTQEPDQVVYEKLTLTLSDNGHAVYIEAVKDPETKEEVEYESTPEGYIVRNLQNYSEEEVEGSSFIEGAVEQFLDILKTPQLHLKQLVIDLEPPISTSRKIEAAHQMYYPEDKDFKCAVPEGIKNLYDDNRSQILELLEHNLQLHNFKLSVECFKVEFKGFPYLIQPIISSLQPKTLKGISIDSDFLWLEGSQLVHSEQWKKAEQLECFCGTNMNVEHWKHFRTVDIELESTTKEELDKILETFLFLSTWKHISMQSRSCKVPRNEYFEEFNIAETTVIPGIVDNWVIEVPKMNQRVFVIFSEGTLHLSRVANRKKPVAIKRKFREAEATLPEMPIVWVRSAVEQLDEMSRRSLGQTCRSLHHFVSKTSSTYEKLTLTLPDNRSAIFIELFLDPDNESRLELEFEQDSLGYTVKNPQEGWEQTVVYNQCRHELEQEFDFIGGAVNHFLKIFTKKTIVKKLCIVTEGPSEISNFLLKTLPRKDFQRARQHLTGHKSYSSNLNQLKTKLMDCLAKKQHLLKVQEFECHFGDKCRLSSDILHVLKYLEPKFLERITINGVIPSEQESQEIIHFETWRSVEEFTSYARIPVNMWTHFPKSEVHIQYVRAENMEECLNALLVNTTWEYVLITSDSITDAAEEFLDRLEDQRPVEFRIENSKMIRIPSIPNQFINYQLFGREKISFTRVTQ